MSEKPQPYTSPEPREPQAERWHLKKEFQVGHLITSVLMVGSAFMYVTTVEKRVSLLEQTAQQQKERDARQDALTATAFSSVDARLYKIDDKLDRLLLLQRGK